MVDGSSQAEAAWVAAPPGNTARLLPALLVACSLFVLAAGSVTFAWRYPAQQLAPSRNVRGRDARTVVADFVAPSARANVLAHAQEHRFPPAAGHPLWLVGYFPQDGEEAVWVVDGASGEVISMNSAAQRLEFDGAES